MKKAFAIASLAVWSLGLLVGMGFAVAAEVAGVHELPLENRLLRTERDSLLETIAIDRKDHAGRVDHYLVAIGRLEFQNKMIIESLRLNHPIVTTLGPWPHEE